METHFFSIISLQCRYCNQVCRIYSLGRKQTNAIKESPLNCWYIHSFRFQLDGPAAVNISSLFALDKLRLYSLFRSSAKLWHKSCLERRICVSPQTQCTEGKWVHPGPWYHVCIKFCRGEINFPVHRVSNGVRPSWPSLHLDPANHWVRDPT